MRMLQAVALALLTGIYNWPALCVKRRQILPTWPTSWQTEEPGGLLHYGENAMTEAFRADAQYWSKFVAFVADLLLYASILIWIF